MVYDVGHMAVAGGDVVKIAQTYADRVLAVHFKNGVIPPMHVISHGMSRIFYRPWSGNLCRGQPRRGKRTVGARLHRLVLHRTGHPSP